MFTDITPAKQAEEALKKKNEELFASYEQLAAAEEELRQNYDELAKAQGRVQESEERYRAVIEDQTEFICRFTPDGRLTFVNDAYCRYFGIDKNECLNRLHTVKLFQEDARLMKHHLSSLSPANPVARIEHRITLPSGEVRWQQWNDRAIYAPDGQVTEYQSVGRDITDRRQTEEALRQANHRLTVMTGITRHDIGNQILVILSYLEMARTEHADPAMDEYIGKLESAARSIRAQIEFSKVYQDIGSQKPRWLDGEFLLHRLTVPAPVKVTAGLGGVEVYADPMLEKLFANLLDNSIRHGETVTEIRVSSRLSDEGLTLLWEDNGVGIAADDKERIFERGFGKNTGLGLFLCREILSLTGMGITETGEPKKGARFEITVPKGSFRYTSRK
jgi:PAS domain S-box-containing protein